MSAPECRTGWDDLIGQDVAVSHLRAAVESDSVSHAYLFVGPPGVGKKTAARALACSVLCDDGGCVRCAVCTRIRRDVHPDVHMIRPEGASGYLVEQVRDGIVHDVHLAPIEAKRKIYILESADRFNPASANAFLKTLEEPPASVIIILLADEADQLPETILSRCQVIRFARIPEPLAVATIRQRTGATEDEALAALAASGGVLARAVDLVRDPDRKAARDACVAALDRLDAMDGQDVLEAAKGLLDRAHVPLEALRDTQADEAAALAEAYGRDARPVQSLQERHKRELTALEREGVLEIISVAESWLRDCLVVSQGATDLALNRDATDAVERFALVVTPQAVVRGVAACATARRRLAVNVSPQLAVEAMLFDIREVLRCPR